MRRSLLILVLGVSMTITACASQSASGGGSGSTKVVDMNGCKVDPAPICNDARGKSVTMSNGMTVDSGSRMVEQNSERTANIFVPVNGSNGNELFEVECGINQSTQSVTWAQIKTGPKLTDEDVAYLRAHGLCSES